MKRAQNFLCPFPCKTEVTLENDQFARCPACGKEFDSTEIEELLMSQGLIV